MMKTALVWIVALSTCLLAGCSTSGRPEANTISPGSADLLTGQSVGFTTNISTKEGSLVWSVNGTMNGNATVGTIDAMGNYTAPAAQPAVPVTVTVMNSVRTSLVANANVTVVAPGQVTGTAHSLVASYTVSPPVAANVSVQFGTDTTYGLTTWSQPAPGNGAAFQMLVGGMGANTVYHMRGVLQMPDGNTLNDMDHAFTTGAIEPGVNPVTNVTNPNGMMPQSGIEMLDVIGPGAVATDLAGNIIWYYRPPGPSSDSIQPVKLLPNGHMIVTFSPSSELPLNPAGAQPGTIDVIREIDLAGTVIHELSIDTLNQRLAAAGFNFAGAVLHHDVTVLPNGHWIVLTNSLKAFTDLPGFPGTTNVLGDALVDLDTNLNPVWMWNSFDHLDVNRHPMQFPDWTHSNAILYSATDGNLLLSIRHQNWILKIDYADGKGAGDVIWHLGEGGEFTLEGGIDPTDWFYAQHGESFTTATTAGKFGLTIFDNGDDRMFPTGETCATSGSATCPYSTAMTLNVDEVAKTATFAYHDVLSQYSLFGGNAETLSGGDVEFDLCNVPGGPPAGRVVEATGTTPAQVVWQMDVNKNLYRAFRLGSLYPGVTW